MISDVREKVNKKYPQLDVEFIQQLQDQIGDLTSSPEPIEIKLFSPDADLLKKWAPKVAERIKKIKGVADVKDGIENTISGSAIVMKVDPVVAARAGFTPQEIEIDASAILQGRAGDDAGGGERSHLHDPRAVSARRAGVARPDPQHDDHEQFDGQDGDAGRRWRPSRAKWGRRKSGARICSGTSR